MTSARRVLSRYIQAHAIGDPKRLYPLFLEMVEGFAEAEPALRAFLDCMAEIQQAYDSDPDLYQSMADAFYHEGYRDERCGPPKHFRWAVDSFSDMRVIGDDLFLSLLQQFVIPPSKIKKVQAAARFWSKSRLVIRPDKSPWTKSIGKFGQDSLGYARVYQTLLPTYREHVALANEILTSAQPHEQGTTKVQAGPFTLVNTGNFSADAMGRVRNVVEKSAKAMTDAGFGKVCYGDIHVTNTITSKNSTLAFYLHASDEMFVRANIKPSIDSVETVCHELAHRLQFKFMPSKQSAINRLYAEIEGKAVDREALPWPSVGQEVVYKGETLVVLEVRKVANKIKFGIPPRPGAPSMGYLSTTLEGWHKTFGDGTPLKTHHFVTPYAKAGGPDENFAEMIAFYVLGKLPADQVELLKAVLP